MAINNISKPFVIAAAATALSTGLAGYVWQEEHRPLILEIYVFALPNGRSMFIRTPEDKRILIDGGGNSDIIREITKILPFYSRRIDAILATNSEGKNVSGLIDVIERYKVDTSYLPAVTLESLGLSSSTDMIYSTLVDTINRQNIEIRKVIAGDSIILDDKVTIKPLFPATPDRFVYSKASAPEILFDISFGKTAIVFLGNGSNKIQKFLASTTAPAFTDSSVLIVSHSALPANMSAQLIGQIKPEYLVYSKAESNKPVAPPKSSTSKTKKKEIVDPLAYLGNEKRFNLKEKGTVKITSDGVKVTVVSD